MRKRNIVIVLLVCMLFAAAAAFASANQAVAQNAVISGTVTHTVSVGTTVKSGDSLVEISTLTGTTSAARATVDGVVKQVLVKQGDTINPGEVVAYIE